VDATFSMIASSAVGHEAYQQPEKFTPLIDLLATIVSILIGISLAISAVLSSRPSVGSSNYTNEEEKKRIEKILKHDDRSLIDGQNLVFWLYYVALIFALVFKWISIQGTGPENAQIYEKLIAGLFGAVASLALLWSATLPSLLRSINIQRKDLD
jgi:TctA family transporter